MPSLSVVIPNYNGKDLLEQNLPFVFDALRESAITDFEVIVADDASKDESAAFIENRYPQIVLVKNKINLGFSGNINTGIGLARKDLILLLNSDVQLSPDYFKAQLAYFEREDTFGVMGRIMSMDRKVIQDTAKYPSYRYGKIGSTKNYLKSNPNAETYSWFMSGANSLVCRRKLNLLGGFREIFNPFYCEDVDLCLRAWRLGFKIYYEHKSVCYHPNSETIKKFPAKSVRRTAKRNQLMLHYLHLEGFENFVFLAMATLKTVLYLLRFNTVYPAAFGHFLTRLKLMNQEKKIFLNLQIKTGTSLTVRDVAEWIRSN
jgi:GT2 family glycosyltransferase